MTDPHVVSLWSGPRNISTATMYAFRSRPDTEVIDEPLYAYYLARTGLEHPGRDLVLQSQSTDGDTVVDDVILADPSPGRPVRFVKNMAHHLVGLDTGFLDRMTNVILTRHPVEMLVSLTKVLPEVDVEATALPRQVEILDRVLAHGGTPQVIDARLVLEDPPGVLNELCSRIGIGWTPAMLSWPAGPKVEDGVWAPYWYGNVHASTGFTPYRPPTAPFPDELESLLAECLPLYERLRRFAIGGS